MARGRSGRHQLRAIARRTATATAGRLPDAFFFTVVLAVACGLALSYCCATARSAVLFPTPTTAGIRASARSVAKPGPPGTAPTGCARKLGQRRPFRGRKETDR